ncbi:MAG: Maf family nucleotide pyrophosphatase [Paracoccaceae bacterium]|nr:Maf family nucleotide pyrophosphatase [Paracoccaceae bacterium]
MRLILASASPVRRMLLERAAVPHEAIAARIDEAAIREALAADGAKPRDVADSLADAKAQKLSMKHPDAMVIGCDQVLEVEGDLLAKAESRAEATVQLRRLSGKTHRLLSAVVIYEAGQPVWRHVGVVRLTMRELSEPYLTGYLERNWDSVRDCVGVYKLEEEGVRLFARIEGEYFTVLGLPLVELLGYLGLRGAIEA